MASGFPGSIDNFTDPLTTSALNSPSHAGQHQDLNDAVEKIETYMGLVKVIPTSVTNGTLAANGTVTIGNAVSSVTVSGAFSSLYDNYQIVLDTTVSANQPAIHLLLGSEVTGYSYGGYYISYVLGTLTGAAASNAAQWIIGDAGNATNLGITTTVNGPFLARRTFMQSLSASTNWSNNYNGMLNTTTSYTAFTIRASTGTITGGTIRVYGYRN